jgi:hypothetical protein|tara:strand:+ start:1560 stop:2255 length:696 start_codon:yes stop_codon:yes gene_type:complete
MAGEAGFIYETKIHKALKAEDLVPAGFTPAGSDANAPDAMFLYGGKDNKLEIKLDLKADYGQGSLSYDFKTKKWGLGGAKTASAQEMRDLLNAVGILKFVKQKWGDKGSPNKGQIPSKSFTDDMVKSDYARFKDAFLPINTRALWDYYATKKTYYIQVGGYGLYYMKENPANLPVPQFNPKLRIRIRVKRGGSRPIDNYRFTTALQVVTKPKKSPYDLDKDVVFLKANYTT